MSDLYVADLVHVTVVYAPSYKNIQSAHGSGAQLREPTDTELSCQGPRKQVREPPLQELTFKYSVIDAVRTVRWPRARTRL